MMFVSYLVTINELKFREFLLSVENGEQFSTAFQKAYNKELEELWGEFLRKFKNKG